MTVKPQGFYWHVHHDELIEWCYNYEERARYIRTDKPKNEQEIRFHLFQSIQGNLPNEMIEARQAYNNARQAYNKARQAYDKDWQTYDKTRQAHNKAEQVFIKVLSDNMPVINALHAVECTNCPWDGHTIFPNTQQ